MRHSFSPWILIALLPILTGFGGCSGPGTEDLCSGKYERIFSDAVVAMTNDRRDRSIASGLNAQITSLSDDARVHWEDWAHENLINVQRVLDDVNAMTPPEDAEGHERYFTLKAEVSNAANQLVQIHGLIAKGRVDHAIIVLTRLEKSVERARTLACVK